MKHSKKIYMILTNGFDPDVRVYKEAKYLVSIGFDVCVLCWDRKCEFKDKLEENIDGITIKRFPILSQPGTGMKQILPYIKFIQSVRDYLKDEEYYYLHCHDFDGMMVGMFTKKRRQKKVIFDMHEIYTNYAYAKNVLFHHVFRFILKKVNYIIYVNDEQIKDIFTKEKLVFLPNYPEAQKYMPIEKNTSSQVRINYIGALRDDDSLKCLAGIADQREKYKIGLYGMGTSYEKLCAEFKNSAVYLHGKYNGMKESGEIYRNTDILYCVYNPEVANWKNAYPVKLFEAIVTLTPILVSKNTTAGNFVTEYGIGEEIEYNQQESLLEAIEKICKNYPAYIENLKKISKQYRWENVTKNLDKIYKEKS